MTYKTLKGYTYVVTASEAVTITDSNGLVLEVPAGEQRPFTASTTEVEYSAPCTITQVRGNFSAPSAGGGGGGQPVAPVPEPLGTTTTMLHGHVYTLAVAADTDLSALTVKQYATCELWIDYTAGSVTWPTGLWWAEGSAPTLEAGKSYAIALRNDGVKLRANVQYEDTTPTQS